VKETAWEALMRMIDSDDVRDEKFFNMIHIHHREDILLAPITALEVPYQLNG
jgi:hypothetical protein